MLRGKERRSIGALATATLLSAALLSAAAAALAASPSILIPPLTEASFRDVIIPNRLPARKAAPVSLALAEKIGNRDGSHPPPLQELQLELDRHLGLSVKGLPICPGPLNESGPRTGKPSVCEGTQVGRGTVEAEVAFPEQQPVRIKGRVIVYNGGFENGRTRFWLYAYLPAPVTGAILMPLEIRRGGRGRYGWTGELKVPKIANGAGSITSLGARFRKGIFSASCPDKHLQAHALSRFADGEVEGGAVIDTCKVLARG